MADVTKITSGSLIAAEKVNGTNVYNMDGDKLGTVDDIMIDKISGKAIYAVMSFGGFLGMGEKQHPLPWSSLVYDETPTGDQLAFVRYCEPNGPGTNKQGSVGA